MHSKCIHLLFFTLMASNITDLIYMPSSAPYHVFLRIVTQVLERWHKKRGWPTIKAKAPWKCLELRFCRARIPRTDNHKQAFLEGGTRSLFTAKRSPAYSTISRNPCTAKAARVCATRHAARRAAPSHRRAPSPSPRRLRPVTQPCNVIQVKGKLSIFS